MVPKNQPALDQLAVDVDQTFRTDLEWRRQKVHTTTTIDLDDLSIIVGHHEQKKKQKGTYCSLCLRKRPHPQLLYKLHRCVAEQHGSTLLYTLSGPRKSAF